MEVLKTLMTLCLLNFLEGYSKAERPYMRTIYEKYRWPVADLKNGILSLSLFLAGISCMHLAHFLSWTFSLHKDGGANLFIHLKAIKVTQRIRLESNTLHWFFNESKFHSDIYRAFAPVHVKHSLFARQYQRNRTHDFHVSTPTKSVPIFHLHGISKIL